MFGSSFHVYVLGPYMFGSIHVWVHTCLVQLIHVLGPYMFGSSSEIGERKYGNELTESRFMFTFPVPIFTKAGVRRVFLYMTFRFVSFVFVGRLDPPSARVGAVETQFLS